MNIDWRVMIIGIAALTVIQIAAMHYGINGMFRTVVVGAIALAIGVKIKTKE